MKTIVELVTLPWIRARLTQIYIMKSELADAINSTDDEEEKAEYEKAISDLKYELKLLDSLVFYMKRGRNNDSRIYQFNTRATTVC